MYKGGNEWNGLGRERDQAGREVESLIWANKEGLQLAQTRLIVLESGSLTLSTILVHA